MLNAFGARVRTNKSAKRTLLVSINSLSPPRGLLFCLEHRLVN